MEIEWHCLLESEKKKRKQQCNRIKKYWLISIANYIHGTMFVAYAANGHNGQSVDGMWQ